MDNLKTLFEKGQYDLIVKLTEGSKQPFDMLLRLLSFVSLGDDEKALETIEKNSEILEKNYPKKLIKIHFELLLKNRYFDEAKIALKHYENLPYISQGVEEILRQVPADIEELNSLDKTKMFSIDDIETILLKSSDNSEIGEVVFSLKNYNFNLYKDYLKDFIKRSDVHPNFRTYGLLIFVENNFDENVEFLKDDKLIKVNPKKLPKPFEDKAYDLLCEKIYYKTVKDISIQETALHLLNCYIIDTYPNQLIENDVDIFSDAFVALANDYFGNQIIIDENIKNAKNEIKKIIESTPELRF